MDHNGGGLSIEDFLYSLARTPAPLRFQKCIRRVQIYESPAGKERQTSTSDHEDGLFVPMVSTGTYAVSSHPSENLETEGLDALEIEILNLKSDENETQSESYRQQDGNIRTKSSNTKRESHKKLPNETNDTPITSHRIKSRRQQQHKALRQGSEDPVTSQKVIKRRKSCKRRRAPVAELQVVEQRDFGAPLSSLNVKSISEIEDPIISDEPSFRHKIQRSRTNNENPKPLSVLQHKIKKQNPCNWNNDLSEFKLPPSKSTALSPKESKDIRISCFDGFEGREALPTGITMSIRRRSTSRCLPKLRQTLMKQLTLVSSRPFGDSMFQSSEELDSNMHEMHESPLECLPQPLENESEPHPQNQETDVPSSSDTRTPAEFCGITHDSQSVKQTSATSVHKNKKVRFDEKILKQLQAVSAPIQPSLEYATSSSESEDEDDEDDRETDYYNVTADEEWTEDCSQSLPGGSSSDSEEDSESLSESASSVSGISESPEKSATKETCWKPRQPVLTNSLIEVDEPIDSESTQEEDTPDPCKIKRVRRERPLPEIPDSHPLTQPDRRQIGVGWVLNRSRHFSMPL